MRTTLLSFLVITLFLGPSVSPAEAQAVLGFEVQDGAVVYRHVFEYEELSQEALVDEVTALANQVPMVRDVRVEGNVISGRVEGYSIITERYIDKLVYSSWIALNENKGILFGWKIEVRDGRYRLSVDRFEFEEDSFGITWSSEDLYRKRKQILDERKVAMNVMTILSGYLKDTFSLSQSPSSEDEW